MSPITNRIIHSRRTFSRGSRIPAGSMGVPHSTDQQEEGQEGLITEQLIKNYLHSIRGHHG